jgi:hypothetical protein
LGDNFSEGVESVDSNAILWGFILAFTTMELEMGGWTNIYVIHVFGVAAAILFLYAARGWILGWLRRIMPSQVGEFIEKRFILCLFLMGCIGIVIIDGGIYIHKSHERPPMVIGELHATLPPIVAHGTGTVSGPGTLSVVWHNLGYAFWVGAVILFLVGVKKRQWPFRKKETINKKQLLQELYNELDSIAKDKWVNYNYQSIGPAIGQLRVWKDKAKRILFKLFGQEELNNFNDKIRYVDEKNEYRNPDIGKIEAFYNEKETYLIFLKDLLDSLEKYPELWS